MQPGRGRVTVLDPSGSATTSSEAGERHGRPRLRFAPSGDGRAPVARGAASPTNGCWRRWGRCRARSSCPRRCAPRLRGLGPADRRRPDDLPALDRRRDLSGAGVGGAGDGVRGRHRVGLLGLRAVVARRRGGRHRAPRVPRGRGAGGARPPRRRQRRGDRRRRQPRPAGTRPVRRDRRPRHGSRLAAHAALPARRRRSPRHSDRRRRSRHAHRLSPQRRRVRGDGDRALPLRPLVGEEGF